MKSIYLSLVVITSIFSTACASGGALRIIQEFEDFRPTIYDDGYGNPTIGFGHLLTTGENFDDVELDEDQARELLISDITKKADISNYITVDLEAYQADALTSLCFNIGIGNFSGSTLVSKINQEETEGAYEYFGHWRKAGGSISKGLVKRRFTELMVFASQELDPEDDTPPSDQWNVEPMPITDENWKLLDTSLRDEAVQIYKDYESE